MDDQIVAHFGRSIPKFSLTRANLPFRVAEAQLARNWPKARTLWVSTGGGALVNAGNRKALAETGVLLCLTATVDEILARLEAMQDRPLLPGSQDERRQRVRNLLHERRQAYASIAHQVDTTGREPAAIVDAVIEALSAEMEVSGMTRINVRHPVGSYHICIGEGLLSHAGTLLANRDLRAGPVAIVTNEDIAAHYADTLAESLRAVGYEPVLCLVPEGEQHKTLATLPCSTKSFCRAHGP